MCGGGGLDVTAVCLEWQQADWLTKWRKLHFRKLTCKYRNLEVTKVLDQDIFLHVKGETVILYN